VDAPLGVTPEDVARLQSSSVPTLANAIELFGVSPSNRGYSTKPLMCHYPALGMAVGVAVTVVASTDQPPALAPAPMDEGEYWEFVDAVPGPKLVAVQDLDDPPGGAMWGEWNANVHRALGCVGTVTDGAARDLDAVAALGFHVFSTRVSVAHGYGRFIGYGAPVSVAGLTIRTGDVLVADRHGVLRLPPADRVTVAELVDVADEIDRLEGEVFAYCQAPGFTVSGLRELAASVEARWPRPRSSSRGASGR
jgi:regulator of RNase E activity RraA